MTSERGECLSLTDMKRNRIIYLWCRNSKCMGTERQDMVIIMPNETSTFSMLEYYFDRNLFLADVIARVRGVFFRMHTQTGSILM